MDASLDEPLCEPRSLVGIVVRSHLCDESLARCLSAFRHDRPGVVVVPAEGVNGDAVLVEKRNQSGVVIDLSVEKDGLCVLHGNIFLLVVIGDEPKGVVVPFEPAVGEDVVVSVHG